MSEIKYSLKKILENRNLLMVIFGSVVSVIFTFLLLSVLVWQFRVPIFERFMESYVESRGYNRQAALEGLQDITGYSVGEKGVVEAVKTSNPAVVSIIISKEVPKYEPYMDSGNNDLFGSLFPGLDFTFPAYRQNGTEKKEIGGGSGFFVSSQGLILTNKHVVDQENAEYSVFTNDGKKHLAKVVDRDPVLDIALIRIEGSGFPYLSLGDSDLLQVGQSVIAIGNALGEFRNTVSVGVVSGLARSITAGDRFGKTEILDHVIQTDAAINPGNSGGPLLDLSGKVVGVNVAVAEGSQNIGFALPINVIKGAIDSVKTNGKIIRPYVGIRYLPVTPELKEKNNLSVDYGILVMRGNGKEELGVIPGSPADKAGIVENDVILEVDGVKLDENTSFASIIRQKKAGDRLILKILHRGSVKTVPIVLESRDDD